MHHLPERAGLFHVKTISLFLFFSIRVWLFQEAHCYPTNEKKNQNSLPGYINSEEKRVMFRKQLFMPTHS